MRCRYCLSYEAYLRSTPRWKRGLLALLLLAPVKCERCLHAYLVPWFPGLRRDLIDPASRRNANKGDLDTAR
jgi:hypothetical protein